MPSTFGVATHHLGTTEVAFKDKLQEHRQKKALDAGLKAPVCLSLQDGIMFTYTETLTRAHSHRVLSKVCMCKPGQTCYQRTSAAVQGF